MANFGLLGTISHQNRMQSVSRKTSGLSAIAVQESLPSMHHQPESRLAQSQACTFRRDLKPALVGGSDTFTLGSSNTKGRVVPVT